MSAESHNKAILPLLKLIVEAAPTESEQWVLIETLSLAIGKLNGRTVGETAVFVETVAERLAEGSRT